MSHFGNQGWWPGDTPWEVAVGAVLTQNTNWLNVEKAITNLKSRGQLGHEEILGLKTETLAEIIKPSGYFNVKANRLKNVAQWWLENYDADGESMTDLTELRSSLLAVKGVGEETADSILLYAFERLTFVVDAYTRKFLQRHGMGLASASYGEIKVLFEDVLPRDIDIYKEYHALIVMLGKHFCRTKPKCEACPLNWHLRLK